MFPVAVSPFALILLLVNCPGRIADPLTSMPGFWFVCGLSSDLQGNRERSYDLPSAEQEPRIVPLGI